MTAQSQANGRAAGPVAETREVVMRFDGVTALDGVSLRIEPREVVGLIGPNGSGKTTLINILSGTLPASEGVVVVMGTHLAGHRAHEVAHLGVGRTFQQIRVFPEMSVYQNVEVGALAHGISPSPEAIHGVLERVGLRGYERRDAGTLAYGSQRRLEIARAVAGRPRLLLLDEPAAGLNDAETDELLGTIQGIRRQEGCAVLVVDHDLRLILRLCDRIHVLAEGRTIADGAPGEVRENPAVIRAYLGDESAGEDGQAYANPRRQ
jgi:ABC-type branched-subunit amino acid transport system ATPase component